MSRLLENSDEYRNKLISKNTFSSSSPYNFSHPNALSDGDEKGKGQTNTIGGATDIKQRETLLTKSKYNSGNQYNVSNA